MGCCERRFWIVVGSDVGSKERPAPCFFLALLASWPNNNRFSAWPNSGLSVRSSLRLRVCACALCRKQIQTAALWAGCRFVSGNFKCCFASRPPEAGQDSLPKRADKQTDRQTDRQCCRRYLEACALAAHSFNLGASCVSEPPMACCSSAGLLAAEPPASHRALGSRRASRTDAAGEPEEESMNSDSALPSRTETPRKRRRAEVNNLSLSGAFRPLRRRRRRQRCERRTLPRYKEAAEPKEELGQRSTAPLSATLSGQRLQSGRLSGWRRRQPLGEKRRPTTATTREAPIPGRAEPSRVCCAQQAQKRSV